MLRYFRLTNLPGLFVGRFYKDDSHSAYWGEGKYSGGRNGSPKNFPGVGGVSALVSPASRFVVYFHSDGSNNDWGYKITVTPSRGSSATDTSRNHPGVSKASANSLR